MKKVCLTVQLTRTLAPALAALLLALSGCGGSGEESGADSEPSDETSSSSQEAEETGAGPQPDLEGVPDVVAEVNGTEIGKDEFESAYTPQFRQMAMQSQTSGEKVDEEGLKKQVVDNLVNAELLVQEADERGFTASQEQTDASLEELAKQNGLESGDQFIAALEEQGMDREAVESQVQDQVQIDQLLADEAGDSEPTEKDMRALYAQLKAQQEQAGAQGQKIPPFEKVKSQLAEQLKAQDQSEVANTLLEGLREDADIEVHI